MRKSLSIVLVVALLLCGRDSWARQKQAHSDKKGIEFRSLSAPIPGVPLEKGKIGKATQDTLVIPLSRGSSPGNVQRMETSQTIEFKALSGPIPGVAQAKGKVDVAMQEKPAIPQSKENMRGNVSKSENMPLMQFKPMGQPIPGVPLEPGKADKAQVAALTVARTSENVAGKIDKIEGGQLLEFKAMSEPVPGVPLARGGVGYAGSDSLAPANKQQAPALLEQALILPNLVANFTPSGWDAPIVASNVTGTHTTGLLYAGTTYIDFAFINRDADIPATTRFYVYLYYEGSYVYGWYWDGIGKDYYGYLNDYQLPFAVTSGSHTLKTKIDATGMVGESNELDNEYSKVFTWLPAKPNLIANYTPVGWDGPIVASNVTGTRTTGTLYAGTTYVDFAFANNDADVPTTSRFYIYLYYDGAYINGWYWDGIPKGYYGHVDDYQLPFSVTAGIHTLKSKIDATGVVDESNELDNEYSQQFIWLTPPTTKPNLIANYTPLGWDAPIVASNVPGTHTTGTLSAGTAYVDFAFVNRDQDVPTSTRFYIYLYYDGSFVQGWYWDGIPKDYYGHIDDYPLPFTVTAGTHILKSKIDATGTVDESNEVDNEYSRVLTWLPAKPNLVANYTPVGWDGPIVASNVTGTHTTGTLYAGTTYLDFAFINRDADVPTSTRLFVYLYYEGSYVYGWYWDGMAKDHYGYVDDYQLPITVIAGTHTLKTKVDATGVIDESNELDNEYSQQFTWLTAPTTKPNLIANYTPAGWDAPIVASNIAGTHTTGTLSAGTAYVDFAFVNRDQDVPTTTRFYFYLYYDGSYVQGWYWDGIPKDYYGHIDDYQLPLGVTAGTHTLKTKIDATGMVDESNELDNEYSKVFTWLPAKPNLIANYTPVGWDGPIVASNVTGTRTTGTLYAGTTYVDFAFANTDADVPTSTRFYVYLYYDGSFVQGWYWDGIPKDYYGHIDDYPLPFTVTAGTHILKSKIDATGTVDESNEVDNEYSQQFTWLTAPTTKPNLIANYAPVGWDYPVVVSNRTGTHTLGTLNAGTAYIDFAFVNRDQDIPTSTTFYVYLYYDGSYLHGWSWDGMPKDFYGYLEDFQIPFAVTAGAHTIRASVDATNVVQESNESDNMFEKQYIFGTAGKPKIRVTPATMTIEQTR